MNQEPRSYYDLSDSEKQQVDEINKEETEIQYQLNRFRGKKEFSQQRSELIKQKELLFKKLEQLGLSVNL